jgi:hypothetical protein
MRNRGEHEGSCRRSRGLQGLEIVGDTGVGARRREGSGCARHENDAVDCARSLASEPRGIACGRRDQRSVSFVVSIRCGSVRVSYRLRAPCHPLPPRCYQRPPGHYLPAGISDLRALNTSRCQEESSLQLSASQQVKLPQVMVSETLVCHDHASTSEILHLTNMRRRSNCVVERIGLGRFLSVSDFQVASRGAGRAVCLLTCSPRRLAAYRLHYHSALNAGYIKHGIAPEHGGIMVLSDRISHWIENLPDPSEPSLRRSTRKRSWDKLDDNSMQQTPERRARILTPNTSAGDLDNNAESTPRPLRSSAFTTLASVPDLRPSPSASSASSIRSSATHSATGSS